MAQTKTFWIKTRGLNFYFYTTTEHNNSPKQKYMEPNHVICCHTKHNPQLRIMSGVVEAGRETPSCTHVQRLHRLLLSSFRNLGFSNLQPDRIVQSQTQHLAMPAALGATTDGVCLYELS